MQTYSFTIGQPYREWTAVMRVTENHPNLIFTEVLTHEDSIPDIVGRNLTIDNICDFKQATNISTGHFEDFLLKKLDKKLLTIDHIQRLCELHNIKYNINGSRIATAYRAYFKNMRESSDERRSKGFKLCIKAQCRIHGTMPGIPIDLNKAESLLKEAIGIGYVPAYAYLADFYRANNKIKEAMNYARKGVDKDNGASMIILAELLSNADDKTIKPDYKRAGELYIKAAKHGLSYKSYLGLKGLIKSRKFIPQNNLYMQFILIFAKLSRERQKERQKDYLKDRVSDSDLPTECLVQCHIYNQKWDEAVKATLKGINAEDSTCLELAARLSLIGADFINFSQSLGEPDYKSALKWSLLCIEEDLDYGFKILNHLIKIGQLKFNELSEEIANRLSHFNSLTPEDEQAKLYLVDFDGLDHIDGPLAKLKTDENRPVK